MNTLLKVSQLTLILISAGCFSIKEVSTYKDIVNAKINKDLEIVTNDSTIYYSDDFNYTDSSITFSGERLKNDNRQPFAGTLLFKNIGYMQTSSPSTLGSLAFLTASGCLIYAGMSAMTGKPGLETMVRIVYPAKGGGGTGSCPYIYLWNESGYKLQGEAFGTALGKSLECETNIILQNHPKSQDELKIKITNERPETHFFNKVELIAIETDKNKTVYSDNRNSFYAVGSHKEIFRAKDINNMEITDLLLRNDDNYWESDLSSAASKSNYEDVLIIELNKLSQIDSIALIVSAINTEISSVVFSYLQKLLGNEFLNFTKAAETDPEVTEILKEYVGKEFSKN